MTVARPENVLELVNCSLSLLADKIKDDINKYLIHDEDGELVSAIYEPSGSLASICFLLNSHLLLMNLDSLEYMENFFEHHIYPSYLEAGWAGIRITVKKEAKSNKILGLAVHMQFPSATKKGENDNNEPSGFHF